MQFTPPPLNEQELRQRCEQIAGLTLAELAANHQQKVPETLINSKGWLGTLLELALGASSKSLPQADFHNLGIELKTLPVNKLGQPQESTYVCTATLNTSAKKETWKHSRVREKLARVLWVPFEACPSIPIKERRIGTALLWSPDEKTENQLREDWEELTEMLLMGKVDVLSARFGTYLQIRPKALNSRILQNTIDEQGNTIWTCPKGFYLRSSFTQTILAEHYMVVSGTCQARA